MEVIGLSIIQKCFTVVIINLICYFVRSTAVLMVLHNIIVYVMTRKLKYKN